MGTAEGWRAGRGIHLWEEGREIGQRRKGIMGRNGKPLNTLSDDTQVVSIAR